MRRNKTRYLIGIDEVGRGPLAGPVIVAGVKINPKRKTHSPKLFDGIRDSKKLSPRQREVWYTKITGHPDVQWAVARVWPGTIDRINILQATLRAARRVHRMLSPEGAIPVLLDGGLFLPAHVRQETIIKGDEKIPVISAASIIAKVTRDRLMIRLHKKYPQYRFDLHKGYGTVLHREMIQKFGRCDMHRRSFSCC